VLPRDPRIQARENYIGSKLAKRDSLDGIENCLNLKSRIDAPELASLDYSFAFPDITRRDFLRRKVLRFVDITIDQCDAAGIRHPRQMRNQV